MLRSLKELKNYRLTCTDGDVGSVHDAYFDDHLWVVRYLVADAGGWLTGRRVLLSPTGIVRADWLAAELQMSLTREQIENSPSVELDRPVSRQKEHELSKYYGWPIYWGGSSSGWDPRRNQGEQNAAAESLEDESADPTLRSVREVTGYDIVATDGTIGHVEDFIASEDDWCIRYMVVDTRNWLPGRKVLVAPWMIQSVDWSDRSVRTELSKQQIKESPRYDPQTPVNREFEARYYDFFGRPAYWSLQPH